MIKAVIFDMDGVISDTQKFHAEVESLILKEYGIDMSPDEITKKYSGVVDEVMFAEIFADNKVKVSSISDVVFTKWERMREVAAGRITAIPHAKSLVKELRSLGMKLAIASASTPSFISEVLEALQLTAYFDTLVSAKEVANGKPAPDIFLLASERLGIKPEEAIVIEDGRSGMIGAKAAGMKSIGLVSDVSLISEYPATRLVTSLAEITEQLIQNL